MKIIFSSVFSNITKMLGQALDRSIYYRAAKLANPFTATCCVVFTGAKWIGLYISQKQGGYSPTSAFNVHDTLRDYSGTAIILKRAKEQVSQTKHFVHESGRKILVLSFSLRKLDEREI